MTSAFECLDDDHATAAARARRRRGGGTGVAGIGDVSISTGLRGRREQSARLGDVVSASAAGEQAVMANAMKSARQDVNEKAANELRYSEGHGLVAVSPLDPIVFPSERDRAIA